ncbi:hypothetical protein, partial [Stenotrophomonas maltophilia]|uniref:hypothetical protein n=1 Tax=Stenotrophomonas maltophilia TaxID=40324 RepID=UPI0028125A25
LRGGLGRSEQQARQHYRRELHASPKVVCRGSVGWTGGLGIPSPDAPPAGMCTDGQLNLNGT